MHMMMQLCHDEIHFGKLAKEKNNIIGRFPLKYDSKRPRIDHNSDKPLLKYCW